MNSIHFINPNYHVILIHYPLGLLGLGLLIEIFSFLWPRGTFRAAGRWMILIGALATVPAATSGMFAKFDIIRRMADAREGHWADIKTDAHLTALQWKFLNHHVLFNAIASALAVLAVILWLGGSDKWRRGMRIPALLMLIIAMGLMTFGAYNGGEIVYRTQYATYDQPQSDQLEARNDAARHDADPQEARVNQIKYYVSPLQWHVIGAGLVFALAAAALGLSLRKSSQVRLVAITEPMDLPPTAVPENPANPTAQSRVVRTTVIDDELAPVTEKKAIAPGLNQPAVIVGEMPVASPASRFWIIVMVLAVLTAAGGWYTVVFDHTAPLWDIKSEFQNEIWQPFLADKANHARMLAHLLLGGAIIILAIALAMVSRWGVRSRVLVTFFGLLMVATVAAQIGVGTLMMYDSDDGPLSGFNASRSGEKQEVLPKVTEVGKKAANAVSHEANVVESKVAPPINSQAHQAHETVRHLTTRAANSLSTRP